MVAVEVEMDERKWLPVYEGKLPGGRVGEFRDRRITLTEGGRRITCSELPETAGRFASALRGAGAPKSDRVGFMLPNRLEYAIPSQGAERRCGTAHEPAKTEPGGGLRMGIPKYRL